MARSVGDAILMEQVEFHVNLHSLVDARNPMRDLKRQPVVEVNEALLGLWPVTLAVKWTFPLS